MQNCEVQEQTQISEEKKHFLRLMLQQWKKKRIQSTTQPEEQEEVKEQEEQQSDEQRSAHLFSREEYAQSDFWNKRYTEHKGYFDWYVEYGELKETFEVFGVDCSSSILMVGCGNSKLSEQMYDAGYLNILSIDISEVVVERMIAIASKKEKQLVYQVMDATEMTFHDAQFDYVIDKGTLDALACGQESLYAQKLMKEMMRVAKKSLIIVSHSSSAARKVFQYSHHKILFSKCLPLSEIQIHETKLSLSAQSQLINIIRSQLKDKPMTHILKDKDALTKCLLQFKMSQKVKSEPLEVYEVKIVVEQDDQLVQENEEITQVGDTNQQEHQQEEHKDALQAANHQEKAIDLEQPHHSELADNSEQAADHLEQTTNHTGAVDHSEQVADHSEQATDQVEGEEHQQDLPRKVVYAPKRQDFCYVYSISRL